MLFRYVPISHVHCRFKKNKLALKQILYKIHVLAKYRLTPYTFRSDSGGPTCSSGGLPVNEGIPREGLLYFLSCWHHDGDDVRNGNYDVAPCRNPLYHRVTHLTWCPLVSSNSDLTIFKQELLWWPIVICFQSSCIILLSLKTIRQI